MPTRALSTIPGSVRNSRVAGQKHSGDGTVVGRGGCLGYFGYFGSGLCPVVGGSRHRYRVVYDLALCDNGRDVFPGEYRPWHGLKFTLTLRAGTSIADNTYYSAAPLQTDANIALVQRIEKYLQTQE